MSFGGITLALKAVQAVSQIGQGRAQQAEANYNASLLNDKAGMIDMQKGIEATQYERLKSQMAGKQMAAMGAAGVGPSGSPMAVMIETQKQINIDKAIGQYNLEREKFYTKSEAEAYKRQGKRAATSGYMNAFTTMLSGASEYAKYSGAQKSSFFKSSFPESRSWR